MAARITRWNPQAFIASVDGAMAQRMERASGLLEADVKGSMVGGGKPHVPSRPGEPPHVDTGGLRRSVRHLVIVQNGVIRGFVQANHVAAHALEVGYAPGNLLARPYLRPALARMQPRIIRILLGQEESGYLSLSGIRQAQHRGFVARVS